MTAHTSGWYRMGKQCLRELDSGPHTKHVHKGVCTTYCMNTYLGLYMYVNVEL